MSTQLQQRTLRGLAGFCLLLFIAYGQLSAQDYAWAKRMGGTGSDFGRSITVDASGNVYTTGYFQGTVDFDPNAGTANLTAAGETDIFVQKLDASGNLVWAKRMGGAGLDLGFGITVDASGNVYTTGYFQGTVDFDPNAGTANLTAAGSRDIFVSKLSLPDPEINVQGNGVSIVNGDATPSTTDHTEFGNVNIGNNLVRTFTIQNTGTTPLTITSIVSNNVKFVISGAPISVTAGGSATFNVTYTPTVAELDNATITINNNDSDEGVYDFAVQGTGNEIVSSLSSRLSVGKLALYPNPATSSLSIALEGNPATEIAITLLDAQGKKCLEQLLPVEEGKALLPLQGMAAGLHILHIRIGKEWIAEKVMIGR